MTTADYFDTDRTDLERDAAVAHVRTWRRRKEALWVFAGLTLLAGLTGAIALAVAGFVAAAFFAIAGAGMQAYLFVVVARICSTFSLGSPRP